MPQAVELLLVQAVLSMFRFLTLLQPAPPATSAKAWDFLFSPPPIRINAQLQVPTASPVAPVGFPLISQASPRGLLSPYFPLIPSTHLRRAFITLIVPTGANTK